MAAQGANVDQEGEIPVFTMMKNNAILKNIFVINSGPPISETIPQELSEPRDSSKTCQDFAHTLLVGRHPDCDIRLEHPSISRSHLRIHSNPSFKRLSVTDLSSVHGTWISGKRMKPNIRVDVNEGDALKIGGSTRVYRLHWVPFYRAYDSDNPFVPPLDVPPVLLDEEMGEEIKRDENTPGLENEMQSVNSASPEDLLSIQFETSEEMKDVNTMLYENEDEKSMELGREFSMNSALDAIKALVSNHSKASKEMENENALVCKTEGDVSMNNDISKDDQTPIIIVVPGISSDSNSPYLKHLAYNTAKSGWNVVMTNHRGLGGVSITSDCFYNAGWTQDIRTIVRYLHSEYAAAPLYVIGTSVGANVLVKYLGEDGDDIPIAGAVAICSPWDLLIGDRFIGRRLVQKFHDRALAITLQGYAKLHQPQISQLANCEGIKKSFRIRDSDHHATIIVGKYEVWSLM